MKTVLFVTYMILFTSVNILFAQDTKMILTPVENFPSIHSSVINDDDIKKHKQSGGMYFSEDGRHSVGEVVIQAKDGIPVHFGLFIDGLHLMTLPCDRLLWYIRVFPESGFFTYGYKNCISDKSYEVLCLAGKGELFTLEYETLEYGGISDAWFEKIEGVPYIFVVVSQKQGRYQSWGVDPESLRTMIPLGENQNYIYKTFSSPDSKVSFRLKTEENNYLQKLVYVDSQGNEKAITGPCKAIYGIHAYKDSCYFATISEQGKTYYNYWKNGNLKILDFESLVHPEDVKIVEETDGKKSYTIKTKDKEYGPFPLANSLVFSGDYSHWSAVVKRTADSKFCFIIDGKFSQEFDDIMKINDYIISDSWHTYARRGNQWYRVEIKWNDTSGEK